MDMIKEQDLILLGALPSDAFKYCKSLNEACQKFSINTPARLCAFLAQLYTESHNLTKTKEDFPYFSEKRLMEVWPRQFPNYATAYKYARGRDIDGFFALTYDQNKSLGNTQKGDGRKFIGRGLIQLTGRFNAEKCGDALGVKFTDMPELLEHLPYSVLSAAWYWNWKKLNILADEDNLNAVTLITQKVQGADGDLVKRQALWLKAKQIFKNK